MKKRLLSALLALCMVLSLVPAAFAAGSAGYSDSGSTAMTKLTQVEIAQLMEQTQLSDPTQIYSTAPGLSAPYSAGALRQDVLQAGLDRLNALRRIAGLPAVSLDASYTASTQAAALVNAANYTMSHYPVQPSGMDSALYQQGYTAAGRSNIAYYYGYRPVDGPLAFSVDQWMDDSDFSNIDRLGHRRWQLNPAMGKTGFGAVYDASGSLHSAEYSWDTSGSGVDYNFIAWPASGNFPAVDRVFNTETAWSVTLNPSKYQTPSLSAVSVTLKRQSDGKSWTFNGSEDYSYGIYGRYFNVETGGYGVNNCIIFRPDGVGRYDGVYTVTITGLRTRSGGAETLSYQVDFFDPKNPATEPENPTTPTFTDVPASEWYAASVYWAVEQEITSGTGNNTFTPGRICSHGEIITFLWRAAGKPASSTQAPVTTEPYDDFRNAANWAYEKGIIDRTFRTGDNCTRADTVTYMWKAAGSLGAIGSGFTDVPEDADYAAAVNWAVANGVTAGYGSDTTFSPNTTCTRGEIVTFLYRAYA